MAWWRSGRTGQRPARRRVLVAEDDHVLRDLLADLLEQDGWEVLAAASTGEARLEMLLAQRAGPGGLPSVLLTDRRMPDGDGLDLVAALREAWGSLPAVLLTAYADDQALERARRLGDCQVLCKPVETDVLRRAVRQAVRG